MGSHAYLLPRYSLRLSYAAQSTNRLFNNIGGGHQPVQRIDIMEIINKIH
jgi:hypothetical protein